MALDFPTNPALNEIYTYGGRSWQWNGTAWDVYSTVSGNVVTQLNGLTGGVTLAAGSNITLTPFGNTITIESSGGGGGGISGPYVISFNGLTGAVTGVSSIRGLTGAVGLTNGSGIGLSVSGNTLTVSNTGVLSFNGLTGAVSGLTTGSLGGTYGSIQYKSAEGLCGSPYFTITDDPLIAFKNTLLTFIGPTGEDGIAVNAQQGLQISRVSDGLGLDEGGGAGIYSVGYDPANSGIANLYIGAVSGIDDDLNSSINFGFIHPTSKLWTRYVVLSSNPTADPRLTIENGCVLVAGVASISDLAPSNIMGGTFTALTRFIAGISASGATFSENISAPNIVNSVRGLTGAVGITNGSGIGLSVSGNTLTVSNIGVLSVNGATGAITNVAKTNVDNNFSASQTISGGDEAKLSIIDAANSTQIDLVTSSTPYIYSTDSAGDSTLQFTYNGSNSILLLLPDESGTLALTKNVVSSFNGLTGSVTGVTTGDSNIFGPLQSFTNGISSAGGTFSALTRFTAGISASGGMTLAGSLQSSTATFTGLVSSSVGFSGAATNLTGNASGLTAGTATRIIATATNSASTFYPTFVGGAGNTGLFIDPTIGPLSYIPSTATLKATNLDLGNGSLIITPTDVTSNDFFYFIATNGIYLQDETLVQLGDVAGAWEGTVIEVLPQDNKVKIYNVSSSSTLLEVVGGISASAGMTLAGSLNLLGTLLINGAQGSSNQVLTSTGSGITWATPSGSGGGITRSISTINTSTAAGSAASTDYVYNGNTSGNITLTMPTAVSNTNRYTVKQSGSGTLTISTTSSQTIDGGLTYGISTQYTAIDLLSDGSNWFVV